MSDKAIPSIFIQRNEYGLITGFDYQYEIGGLIDWRKMINPKYLTPNRQNFEKQNKPIPDGIDGLEDKDLLIILAGFKSLAQIRGFTSIKYNTISPNENIVIVTCEIKWIPNFETENKEIIFSAIGDATPLNTNGFGKMFLGPLAENRAFVRCVRNFLRIPILGVDELGPKTSPTEIASNPNDSLLESLMKQHNFSFQVIKNTLIKDKFEGVEKINCVADIPRHKQLELIGKIKKKVEQKESSV